MTELGMLCVELSLFGTSRLEFLEYQWREVGILMVHYVRMMYVCISGQNNSSVIG